MYARVAVARPLTGLLTYAIPPHVGPVGVGHVVLVPIGSQGETGYVVDTTTSPDFDPERIKPVSRLLDPHPAFDSNQLAFLSWAADYYMAPLGMMIHTALPSSMRARIVQVIEPTEAGANAVALGVAGVPGQVLREVIARPGLTRRGMVRRLAAELDKKAVNNAIDTIVRHGWAELGDKEIGESRGMVRTVELVMTPDAALAAIPRAGRRMRALIDALAGAGGPVDLKDLLDRQGTSARSSLNRLETVGVVRYGEREQRDALLEAPALGASEPPPLNPHQREALDALRAGPGTYLLFGVTGSGKTEVFLGAAAHTLEQGKQVLVLVPEIGLTPQLVGRFRARFGDTVAVLHSGLTGSERLAEWRRIRAGEARVAVGARSALFAPFDDLGLVVVDEEHDDSYKQDDGVRYNARDLAVVLGSMRNCAVVLASATPSLESYYNARTGRYTMLRLPERATPRPVPEVDVVDLTTITEDPKPIFAPEVVRALRTTFDNGGQAIVLYNRRGFATMVQCTSCGGTYECPNCGVTMTYHRRAAPVACHYCGLKRHYDGTCPACEAPTLEELGKGTERVDNELQRLFPGVPTARMDADTTAVRGAHAQILKAFREGKTKLLVGTQIVAKGHDFPDVHTAVVVSADRGFRMPDFRAAERTYSLLVQLAGRAGRGDVSGEVFVQTWNPDHYVLRYLDHTEKYLEHELKLRKTLSYPPFTRLCLVRVEGVNRQAARDASYTLARTLRDAARPVPGVRIIGPAPAALAKLGGRWRFQLIVRGEQIKPFRGFLRSQRKVLEKAGGKGVRVSWDVDCRHLL